MAQNRRLKGQTNPLRKVVRILGRLPCCLGGTTPFHRYALMLSSMPVRLHTDCTAGGQVLRACQHRREERPVVGPVGGRLVAVGCRWLPVGS